MTFNSLVFVYFFTVVWGLYLVLGHGPRKLLLLAASFVFYGWWDWRYLFLLVIHSLVDYGCARGIHAAQSVGARRAFLAASMTSSLGILAVFKYLDFFAPKGLAPHWALVLPVGISFYTFQTMAYVIDVYRGRLPAEKNPLEFMLFVAFFPQLVAGPIERAVQLMPQVKTPRRVSYGMVRQGAWLLLFGYYKKLVVADNLQPFVGPLSADVASLSGSQLFVAFYAMIFYVYADFSGYSDIARGLAKLLGFELAVNFRMPFFAKNPPDFWRRWHITLSDWFRDYVFTPLVRLRGKSGRTGPYMALCALATMTLCGLWHGPAWHYVAFGAVHGLLLVAYYATRPLLRARRWRLPRWLGTFLMFHVLSAAVVLFFIPNPDDWRIFFQQLFLGAYNRYAATAAWTLLLFGGPLLAIDWWQERTGDLMIVKRLPRVARYSLYAVMFAAIVMCGATGTNEFVYFQF